MQFYNVGPEKNELLGSCHRFQEIFNLAKQFSKKTQKKDQCLWIVIWVNLSQNGLLDKNVGSKIGPFELIFNPHIEKHQTYPVSFLKKINLIIKKLIKLKMKDFELNCIVQNLKLPFSQLVFWLKLIFFQKTDWLSLVLLDMWVEYRPILEPKFYPFIYCWLKLAKITIYRL